MASCHDPSSSHTSPDRRARAMLAPRRQTLGELAKSMSVAKTIPLPPFDDAGIVVAPPVPIISTVTVNAASPTDLIAPVVAPAVRTPAITREEINLVAAPTLATVSAPSPRRRERAGSLRRLRDWLARVFRGKSREE
ncbi:hypothetical protein BU16DRAFT_557475 [Lophium mytilinum]|uniref:Uncharacterized protein n=1 Tax=Lophium mytilinum TaxID=390894 RepID=A0A6A6R6L8_9PEZI|nr:hypothetical protein BU16DRAFT_557475 [Lophium mytilinum]